MSSNTNALSNTAGLRFPWLTVERALWGGVLAVAAAARLTGLADTPLSVTEAERALAGWQLMKGAEPAWWDAPALAVGLWALLFTLGDADLVARLIPAAAGIAMVAIPLLWRGTLGAGPALVAGALLALSPAVWAGARVVHEAAPAVVLTLLLARWLVAPPEGPSRAVVFSAGLAMLLNLGAPGVTGLLAMVAYLSVRYATAPAGERALPAIGREWGAPVSVFALAHVLLSTGMLQYPSGFGVPSLAAWVAAATPVEGGSGSISPLLLLGGLEPLAMLAGLPLATAAIVRWVRRPAYLPLAPEALLAVFALVAMLPLLMGGAPTITSLLPAVACLTAIAGAPLGRLAATLSLANVRTTLWGAGALVFLLTFAYLGLARAANAAADAAPLVALLALAGAFGVLGIVAVRSDQPRALAAAAVLVVGALFSAHITGMLANLGLSPYETRVEAAAINEVYDRTAMQALRESGRSRTAVVNPELHFAFAWPLRNVSNVTFGRTDAPEADVVVAPEGANPTHPAGYGLARLPLTQRWQQANASALDTWRWAVWGRPAKDAWEYQRAILLFKDAG